MVNWEKLVMLKVREDVKVVEQRKSGRRRKKGAAAIEAEKMRFGKSVERVVDDGVWFGSGIVLSVSCFCLEQVGVVYSQFILCDSCQLELYQTFLIN